MGGGRHDPAPEALGRPPAGCGAEQELDRSGGIENQHPNFSDQ
jgi:hypothetical protein